MSMGTFLFETILTVILATIGFVPTFIFCRRLAKRANLEAALGAALVMGGIISLTIEAILNVIPKPM